MDHELAAQKQRGYPGWWIVLQAFLRAPGRKLTNIELGSLYGVQAFRSRIADLRRMGIDVTAGAFVRRGVYEYRLVTAVRAAMDIARAELKKPKSQRMQKVVRTTDEEV